MMDEVSLERIRTLTPGQRIELGVGLLRLGWAMLDVPTREAGDRKWALWQRQHDEGVRNILEALDRKLAADGPGRG